MIRDDFDDHFRHFCAKCGHLVADQIDRHRTVVWVDGAVPVKAGLEPKTYVGRQIIFTDLKVPFQSRQYDFEAERALAREFAPVARIGSDDRLTCGACAASICWRDTLWQDKTPGTPLRIGSIPDVHARIFCGRCGAIVAEPIDDTGAVAWVGGAQPLTSGQQPSSEGGERIVFPDFRAPYESRRADVEGYTRAVALEKAAATQTASLPLAELVVALESGDTALRLASAVALGNHREPAAAQALVKAFREDGDRHIRSLCEDLLVGLGVVSVEPVVRAGTSEDPVVRLRTVVVIARVLESADASQRRAVADLIRPVLTAALADQGDIPAMARRALAAL